MLNLNTTKQIVDKIELIWNNRYDKSCWQAVPNLENQTVWQPDNISDQTWYCIFFGSIQKVIIFTTDVLFQCLVSCTLDILAVFDIFYNTICSILSTKVTLHNNKAVQNLIVYCNIHAIYKQVRIITKYDWINSDIEFSSGSTLTNCLYLGNWIMDKTSLRILSLIILHTLWI